MADSLTEHEVADGKALIHASAVGSDSQQAKRDPLNLVIAVSIRLPSS